MFYAVSALLLTKGLSSSKHSGLLGIFNKEFINKGVIDKEIGRFYTEMFEFRQKADYKDLTEFKEEDVVVWLNKAEQFIPRLEAIIDRED